MSKRLFIHTIVALLFVLSLAYPRDSLIPKAAATIVTIPLGDADSSIMRIKSYNDIVYGVLVEGYGYGVHLGEILHGVSRLAVFSVGARDGVRWIRLLSSNQSYKTRGLDVRDGKLYISYTILDENLPRLVLVIMNESGDLINAVATEIPKNPLLTTPGFVNDLLVTDEYIYVAGGWHLFPQPTPYNISPFIYVLNRDLTTGYRISVKYTNDSEISGSIFSLSSFEDQLYFCGSIVDAYYKGSRSDFMVGSIGRDGTLKWMIVFDFYMGIDHCRGVSRVGEYVYAVGRSWYNGLGDHLIIAKIHNSGSVESMSVIKFKAEPISVRSESNRIYVLIGHSTVHMLLTLSLDGKVEYVVELRNNRGGLDMDLTEDYIYISGSTVDAPTRGLLIQLDKSRVDEDNIYLDGIEIVKTTDDLEYEPYFEVNFVDSRYASLHIETVSMVKYSVDVINITSQETMTTSPVEMHSTITTEASVQTSSSMYYSITIKSQYTSVNTATSSYTLDQKTSPTEPLDQVSYTSPYASNETTTHSNHLIYETLSTSLHTKISNTPGSSSHETDHQPEEKGSDNALTLGVLALSITILTIGLLYLKRTHRSSS